MTMESQEKQDSAALEYELQELFDSTSVDAGSDRLNRLARFSAKIPKEVSPWLSPLLRQFGATSCVVLGLFILSYKPSGDSSSHWPAEPVRSISENSVLLGTEFLDEPTNWDSDIATVGFDLLHGTNQIDEDLLEDSFQALLNESVRP